jgi:3-hydroxybutyryl-CoA dehydrogenase
MAVRKVFVAGAGKMGQGIAETAATAGIAVVLSDVSKAKLQRGLSGIEASLNEAIERWAITASEKRAILSRIETVTGLEKTDDCEYAIEAVQENIGLKKEVFRQLDKCCEPGTILVTTTSTLSITDIGAVTNRQDKIVGMHFLFAVPRAEMVEVVRAMKTSQSTFDAAKNLARTMGKEVVEVYEYPGFVTARVMIPFINEAVYALMEGVASPQDIDTAVKLGFGFPMGPLEIADTIGLDDLMLLMESLFRELGEFKYKPCPLIRRMVREGKLGKKTGMGFFAYESSGGRRL